MTFDEGLESARIALKVGLGLAAFLAGLDKFFYLLADWRVYVSPLVPALLPVSAATFLYAVGVIEMVVGIAILTSYTRPGAYVAAAWLVAIALNLLTTGHYFDIAVRDVEMAIAAYALARLTEAREAASVGLAPVVETTGRRVGTAA
jgi:uncharacterized membrane protein YphA (DoxX/SURF4 family)